MILIILRRSLIDKTVNEASEKTQNINIVMNFMIMTKNLYKHVTQELVSFFAKKKLNLGLIMELIEHGMKRKFVRYFLRCGALNIVETQ